MILLKNINIIPCNPNVREKIYRGSILICNGSIVSIFRGKKDAPCGANILTVDFEFKKFVIPSLIDAHVHLHNSKYCLGKNSVSKKLRQLMRWGVFSAFDLYSNYSSIEELSQIPRNDPCFPDIYFAAQCFTPSSGYCTQFGFKYLRSDSPKDIDRHFKDLDKMTFDFLKVMIEEGSILGRYKSIDRLALQRIISLSSKHRYKLIAHISTLDSLNKYIQMGGRVFTHTMRDTTDILSLISKIEDLSYPLFSIPTLTAHESYHNMYGTKMFRYFYFYRHLDHRERLLCKNYLSTCRRDAPKYGNYHKVKANFQRLNLNANNIITIAGTDSCDLFIPFGLSLHHELELFVSMGMKPYAALLSATYYPSLLITKDRIPQTNSISEGADANMIILDKNPLDNIRNTKTIHMLIKNGTILSDQVL